MVKRSAFTLIELIFAIIIISIAVISLPMMSQSTNKANEVNIVQEAVFAAQTILTEALATYWDENSQADANLTGGLSRVIDTQGDCNTTTKKRPGHINRSCLNNLTLSVQNNAEANYTLDWAASNWENTRIVLTDPSGAVYKSKYKASTTIKQCSSGCVQFGTTANNSDIKQLELTVTDENGNTLIKLRDYSTNIGDVEIAKRMIP